MLNDQILSDIIYVNIIIFIDLHTEKNIQSEQKDIHWLTFFMAKQAK